jgi:formylglycine-generating enzyme required for sulfatase activity
MRFFSIIIFVVFLSVSFNSFANNIQTSNVSLVCQNTSAGTNNSANHIFIKFDISWENSWRVGSPVNNWDAAWIFVKFRVGTSNVNLTSVSSSSTTLTVSSTSGLRVGMPLVKTAGTGTLATNTVITAILSATTISVNVAPSVALSGASITASRIWEHAWLNNTGHEKGSLGSSASLQVGLQNEAAAYNNSTNPALGVYLFRASAGKGNFNSTGVKLKWNYVLQGIKDNDYVDVSVEAIENVYVPTGSYYVGVGSSEDESTSSANLALQLQTLNGNTLNNNTFSDGSANNFTITRTGNVSQGSFSPLSQNGWSSYFNGTSSYVTVPDDNGFNFGSSNFTVETWVKFQSLPSSGGYACIYSQSSSANSNNCFNLFYGDTEKFFYTYSIDGYTQIKVSGISNITPVVGQWYHVAVVRNGSMIDLYVNGAKQTSYSIGVTQLYNSTALVSIGANKTNVGVGNYFNGFLTGFRVSNSAIYTGSFAIPTTVFSSSATTSILLFQENRFVDKSSNGLTVSAIGAPRIFPYSPFKQSSNYNPAIMGSSAYFDGTGDYLSLASNASLSPGTSDFTIEAWIYPNAINSANATIFYTNTIGGLFFGKIASGYGLKINGGSDLISVPSLTPYSWTHLAISRQGSSLKLFVNGVLKSTVTDNTNFSAGVSYLGLDNASLYPYTGYISNFRFVKGSALYTNDFAIPNSIPTAVTNTQLLLLFNKANIYDNSCHFNLETVDNAATSTAQFRSGSNSVSSDGNGDGLFSPANPLLEFGKNDFTIEGWYYANSSANYSALDIGLIETRNTTYVLAPMIHISAGYINLSSNGVDILAGPLMPLDKWVHIAVVRSAGVSKLYVNGTMSASSSDANYYLNFLLTLNAKSYYGATSLMGFCSDLRIYRDYAKYTSNFIPVFPNGGLINATGSNYLQITSESSINLGGSTTGNLSSMQFNDDFNISTTQTLSASYPKGFSGYYAMKYELTQQQYVNFLNSLTTSQATARFANMNGNFRNAISVTGGVYSTANPYVACNYLNWSDCTAYADWAGLRPMTELEFEKVCRGGSVPKMGEPAWSSTTGNLPNVTIATGILNGSSLSESASNITANVNAGNNATAPQGPLRVGSFSNTTSTRFSSGGSYFGAMELSGNLQEQVVTIGTVAGRSFTGNLGNGTLNPSGDADVDYWPGINANSTATNANQVYNAANAIGVTQAAGAGFRGGSWLLDVNKLLIADRSNIDNSSNSRASDAGFRAVRNNPSSAIQ